MRPASLAAELQQPALHQPTSQGARVADVQIALLRDLSVHDSAIFVNRIPAARA